MFRIDEKFVSGIKDFLPKNTDIVGNLFPLQCFSLHERNKFRFHFKFDLQPTQQGTSLYL